MEILAAQGHKVTAVPTTAPGSGAQIARRCIEQGADLVLAAGGDGTINEVLNGMVHSKAPLGVLPAGTANVLAVELGLGTRMHAAAELVGKCIPRRIAVGLLQTPDNGTPRYFALMAGAGLDALMVYDLDAGWKARFGKAAYWLGGFGQLGRTLEEFDIFAEGRKFRGSYALASRVRNYGGDLTIARNASLFDDHFELVVFEGGHAASYVKYLFAILANRLAHMPGVTIVRTQEIEIRGASDPRIYIQIDGERAGRLPAHLQIVPNALTLLVPPDLRA